MYSEKVLELLRNPHNYGRMEDPDGVGKVGNIRCGDVMHVYIRVRDGVITDIKFETLGCAAAIATSSVITDMAKGKTLEEALKITNKGIAEELGGLPPEKLHCSVLAADALAEAVYDYLAKSKKPIPKELEDRHTRLQERAKGH
jgi:nitrogen fixation NifU-like protein